MCLVEITQVYGKNKKNFSLKASSSYFLPTVAFCTAAGLIIKKESHVFIVRKKSRNLGSRFLEFEDGMVQFGNKRGRPGCMCVRACAPLSSVPCSM